MQPIFTPNHPMFMKTLGMMITQVYDGNNMELMKEISEMIFM